ncbi:YbaK/EbsC family protein [Halobaculum magnesiiphilum]|uniref:YbaK/EbsC family protein n=1 Tax=Halobaculum magnesiiphilum TaxID=1017351 RepID=A0A8T8WCR6_9EURY|nr:YbaK/EbsC family protein [Halobaculum magnesiiphilum]QZP37625.1 YbaK/EbsC family protein [Halobaculum magnesiiphilum]
MHASAARFAERVSEEYGFDPEIEEFPEGTKTAADAADAVGCSVDQIVKSIVIVADGEVIVVLTAGDNRVDTDALATEIDAESVRTGNPEEVKAATGWSIGGVPPFGHESPVATYLDESLLDHDRIWAAAGTPDAVFELAPAELREIADPVTTRAFE